MRRGQTNIFATNGIAMKPKKLKKYWKRGEVFERGILWDVKNLIKRHLHKRTCRWIKHKNKEII